MDDSSENFPFAWLFTGYLPYSPIVCKVVKVLPKTFSGQGCSISANSTLWANLQT